ncbi:MAG: 4-alpha-glucanotransferase, partial [Oscillospiraceae bacterium]|nr:4-alpha-glucanotransferase [Oscillospiraceae bacterium]
MERAYGVLTPVFSLPSPYGIGTLGKAAFDFIDFLSAAGARWWQVLPVGPTGSGDSPYQTFSTFAGNPWFIDPDLLAADDLLTAAELRDAETAFPGGALVDYGALCRDRLDL